MCCAGRGQGGREERLLNPPTPVEPNKLPHVSKVSSHLFTSLTPRTALKERHGGWNGS